MKNVKKVVVAGGGVLGTQIALQTALSGFEVTMWLRSEGSVGRTKPKIEKYSQAILRDLAGAKALIGNPMGQFAYPRGLIRDWPHTTAADIDAQLAEIRKRFENNLHIELDMAKAVKGADMVIESVSEVPDEKVKVYTALRDLMDEDTILCTNSSTLLPSMFAEITGRPDRYCALHFANNVWKNNTAEIMGHAGTSPETFGAVVQFAAQIGMVPLPLHKEQPGYILNTMLVPFLASSEGLLSDGVAEAETIDLTWKLGTGAALGPFQILDIVGLETAYNINRMKPDANQEGTRTYKIGKMLKEKIDKGETGINAGKGFYDYKK